MEIKELVKQAHARAKEAGWWDPAKSEPEVHMLIVTEIAEATEAVRANEKPLHISNGKPEGEAVELADAVIRIADYFGHKGWDLDSVLQIKMAYNETRSHRHGGKKY